MPREQTEMVPRESLITNFGEVIRATGKVVLTVSIFSFLFAVTTPISFERKILAALLLVAGVFFALAFYFTEIGASRKYYYLPYIVFPPVIFISILIAPTIGPYMVFMYFMIPIFHVIVYGTRDAQYFVGLSLVLIAAYSFLLTTFSLPGKIALTAWLSAALLVFIYHNSLVARELYSQRREVEEMRNLTTDLKLALRRDQALLQNIADGVLAVGNNYRINLFNKAAREITGYTEEEMMGKSLSEFLQSSTVGSEKVGKELLAELGKGDLNRVVTRQAFPLYHKGGKTVYVDLRFAPVGIAYDSRRVLSGHIVSFRDVTRERELEEMKLDFVSMAAHELRTPITSIRGYLSFLEEELTDKLTKEQKVYLSRANISTQQLVALMENLLSVAKIEGGAITLDLKSVDWSDFLQEATEKFLQTSHEKGLKLRLVPPDRPLPEVLADPLRIAEVLNNLLANAINYTREGSVTISAEYDKEKDTVITHVQDTGVGIPAESLPRLFTKFYRVSGLLEQGSKGTGLGLFISKTIVEMHHGRIWAESTLDRGSTFSFSLPVARESSKTRV